MTRFRTPDGLRFVTYQAAQQHWSRERLRQWFYANVPTRLTLERDKLVDELIDRLRQDWHVSRRTGNDGREISSVTDMPDPVVDADDLGDAIYGKGTM